MFEDNDPNKNGSISREEFTQMVTDDAIRLELTEGSNLKKEDLLDVFDCLAVEDDIVEYRELIHSLKATATVATERSVLHVMIRMRAMQDSLSVQIDSKFAEISRQIEE